MHNINNILTNQNGFKKACESVKEKISHRILEVLQESRFGLIILEIAEKTGISRNTIAKLDL